jgi:hypothetical protein
MSGERMNKNEGRKEGREESTKIFSYLLSFCSSHQSLAPPSLCVVLAYYVCHVGVLIVVVVDKRNPHGWNYLHYLPYLTLPRYCCGSLAKYIHIHTYIYIHNNSKEVPKVLPKLTI